LFENEVTHSMTDCIERDQPAVRRISRRQVLRSAGAGAALALGGALAEAAPCDEKPCSEPKGPLKRGDQVPLEGKPEEIIQKAYELGYQYEKDHGGCARCTVAACQDAIPFVPVDVGLFQGSTCLDGGATPTNVQNCGAFTGAGMVIGHLCGSTRDETFTGDAKLAHELLHKVYHRFKEHYGTVLCRDVRKGAEADCPEVVGRASKWVAEALLEEFTDYTPPEPPQEETAGQAEKAGL
jgi:hypothetical protein